MNLENILPDYPIGACCALLLSHGCGIDMLLERFLYFY
jgi:hypothetical protein